MRHHLKTLTYFLYIILAPAIVSAQTGHGQNSAVKSGQIPHSIRFIENMGQWEDKVLFRADIPGGKLYLEKTALTYYFYDEAAIRDIFHNYKTNKLVNCHVVKVHFKNALQNHVLVYDVVAPEYYNYFIGNDTKKHASNVKAYGKATLKNLWTGIDLELLANDGGIKYNFIVHPKANPNLIELIYEGADGLAIKDGALYVKTSLTNIIEDVPISFYGENNKTSKEIKVKYKLDGNNLTFDIGNYPKSQTLIIDPTVIFATFSGSVADNFGFTATYDGAGNTYSGGTVYGVGFPTQTGVFQKDFSGGVQDLLGPRDCGILKFSPDGSQLLCATYIGGNNNEQPHSMVMNNSAELVIMGTTFSSNFPVSSGAFDNTYNGNGDVFIFKLSDDGTQMRASTFIGGNERDGLNSTSYSNRPVGPLAYNYGDEYRGEVIVDKDDNILIASCTQSSNFPNPNTSESPYSANQDGIVVKLDSSLTSIIWAQFIGGSKADAAYGINIDFNGNIFVCGGTQSNKSDGFPSTQGTYNQIGFGERDGFLVKLRNTDGKRLASTFIGTTQYDQAYFVQVDEFDNVYVTGQTRGVFPVSNNVYSNKGGKQFIAVFNNDLSQLLRSSVFGSGRIQVDISPTAFLVDLCGRVYVSGWGGRVTRDYNNETGSTTNLPLTPDAYQDSTDGSDLYLIVLSRNLTELVYASYFGGGTSYEHVDGGTSRFDRNGFVYQSVCGGCGGHSDFPTTEGAWSRINQGKRPNDTSQGGCNNLVFKVDLNTSTHAPVFPEQTISGTVLTVIATDTLEYEFQITDADAKDSIFVSFSGEIFDSAKTPSPLAVMKIDSGTGSVKGYLRWETKCHHISIDTYFVNIIARDNGCPIPRISTGTIKIVVLPQPVPDPPKVFCLGRIDNETIRVSWTEFEFDKFCKEYRLMKRFPDGKNTLLKVLNDTTENSYTDYDANDHYIKDYCYYIYGINVCGVIGDSSRAECSAPDEDSIPQKGYIYTVTVENNKHLRVNWEKYTRKDFYSYILYKKENIPNGEYQKYRVFNNINDTTFLDNNVNVHKSSYCYSLQINNQCGLMSPEGNWGCSILLKGVSVPFEHHLNWNSYSKWPAGLLGYEIERRNPLRQDSVIAEVGSTSYNYVDDKLDYDHGLYWYKVTGYENGGYNAKSLSNEILLMQAPLVHVPNRFTPNLDSTNDVWNVVPVFVKDFHLKVYNRWGGLVWETQNKKELWDGAWKRNMPLDNVFIWQVDYTGWDGSKHNKNGNVTILR